MPYRLRLMGPFELLSPDGQSINLVSKKSKALLAMLALAEGRAVPRARLMAVLWGDRSEEQARNSLRQALAGMRKLFPNRATNLLRITDESVAIDLAALVTDIDDPEGALTSDEFLEGLQIPGQPAQDWLTAERRRLASIFADRLALRISRLEEQGAFTEAILAAQALVQTDPMSEVAHRALMRGYAATGDRRGALKQFEACRDVLRIELGVDPDPETERLAKEIRTATAAPAADAASTEGSRPTIVVLPFASLSSDAEQTYFADGITDDIIMELGRFRAFNVIARTSAFYFKDHTPPLHEVGRILGAQFVLQGSIHRSGDRLRVRVELAEASLGRQLWAGHFDRELADVFAVQDEITSTVSAIVRGRVDAAVQQIAKQLPLEKLGAYDLCLRAKAEIFKFRRRDNAKAQELLKRAIEIDPDSATAHHWLATSYHMEWITFWAIDRKNVLDLAGRHAQIAVDLDREDGRARWKLAEVLQYRGDIAEARSQFEHAMRLCPNDASLLCVYGLFLGTFDELERSFELFERAERLDPFDTYLRPWLKGITCYHARRYAEAIELLNQIANPVFEIRCWLAAGNAQLGRITDASRQIGLFLKEAESEVANFPGRRFEDWEAYIEALAFGEPGAIAHLSDGLRKAWA